MPGGFSGVLGSADGAPNNGGETGGGDPESIGGIAGGCGGTGGAAGGCGNPTIGRGPSVHWVPSQ